MSYLGDLMEHAPACGTCGSQVPSCCWVRPTALLRKDKCFTEWQAEWQCDHLGRTLYRCPDPFHP